jgi:hypothetical protein
MRFSGSARREKFVEIDLSCYSFAQLLPATETDDGSE